MENLEYFFAVCIVIWLGFFGYLFYLSRKQNKLRREIELLKEDLEQEK